MHLIAAFLFPPHRPTNWFNYSFLAWNQVTRIAEIVLARWVIKAQSHKTNKATTTQAVYVEDTRV